VQGPLIQEFEQAFARVLGSGHVRTCSTEYGRMALYFILKAMDFPPGSEIVVPAFTFWVVPEIARVAGLRPVFADIDPTTFTLSPRALENAITERTRAVLPTHLYGMSCDMDPILEIARRHDLKVIEDCAHALGATYKGQMVGTLGDASFFSFQAFKPPQHVWGGLAWMRDADWRGVSATSRMVSQWPTEKRVEGILKSGYWQHTFIRPKCLRTLCSLCGGPPHLPMPNQRNASGSPCAHSIHCPRSTEGASPTSRRQWGSPASSTFRSSSHAPSTCADARRFARRCSRRHYSADSSRPDARLLPVLCVCAGQ
jgi:hypothetical protein